MRDTADSAAGSSDHDSSVLAQISLVLRPDTPHAIRHFASQTLCGGTAFSSRLIDDVTVTVSELVTASYLAGASIVNVGIELHEDHVAATVRDDRRPDPGGRRSASPLREALLDAMTTSRRSFEDALGLVTVARFSTAHTP